MQHSLLTNSASTTLISGDAEIFTSTERRWKKRHCVIIRSSQFSTHLKLYVHKSAAQAPTADAILLEPFRHIHGVSPSSIKTKSTSNNGIVLTCDDDLVILAFSSITNHLEWMDTIKRNVSDVEVRVQLVRTEGCRLAVNTQGRLHVQKSRLCYYTEPADACKHLAVWALNRVRKYYLEAEKKTFVFESKAKCDSSKSTVGLHYFESEHAAKLFDCVHAVCCNKPFRSEVADANDPIMLSSGLTPPQLSSSHPPTAVANLYHQRVQQQRSVPATQHQYQHQRYTRRYDSADYNSNREDSHYTVFNFENTEPRSLEQPDRDYYNLRDRSSYVSMSDVHPLPLSSGVRRRPASSDVDTAGYVLPHVRHELPQQQQHRDLRETSGTLERRRLPSQLSSGAGSSPTEIPDPLDEAADDNALDELYLANSPSTEGSPVNFPVSPDPNCYHVDDPDGPQYDQVAADTPPISVSPCVLYPAVAAAAAATAATPQPPRQKNRPAPLALQQQPLARPAYNRSQSDGHGSLSGDPNSSAGAAAAAAAMAAIEASQLRSPTMRTRAPLLSAVAIASATMTRAQKPRHGVEYISRQRLQSSSSDTGATSPTFANGVGIVTTAPGQCPPPSASIQSAQMPPQPVAPVSSFSSATSRHSSDYVNLRPQSTTVNSYFGPAEPRLQYAQLQHPEHSQQGYYATGYDGAAAMLPPAPISKAAIQQHQHQQLPQQQPQPPPSQFQQQQHFLNYTELDRQKTKAFQDIAEEREARRNPASRSTSSASVNGVKQQQQQQQAVSSQQLQLQQQQQQRLGMAKIK